MGRILSLSEVRSAPSEVVALYDKYRQQIAQVRGGASAKQLKSCPYLGCTYSTIKYCKKQEERE